MTITVTWANVAEGLLVWLPALAFWATVAGVGWARMGKRRR